MPDAVGGTPSKDRGDGLPLKLIMMGTGPFAVPSFDALYRAGHRVLQVITRPEIVGRGGRSPPPSPVRQWAEACGLARSSPESINDPAVVESLNQLQPDLLVVCDYGQILKRTTLAVARLGGINLHGSLLPAYRGAAPVQWALWRGEAETGVSVIHMTPRLDGGPIIALRRTPIGNKETAGELEERLSQLGVDAVISAVAQLERWDGVSVLGEVQDDSKKSLAPRLSKNDGAIDWNRSAREIDWQVRAMQPWPGAFCMWHPYANKEPIRLGIRDVTPLDGPGQTDSSACVPGTVVRDGSEIVVQTGGGTLRLERLQPAGKREMTAVEYARGQPLRVGVKLG